MKLLTGISLASISFLPADPLSLDLFGEDVEVLKGKFLTGEVLTDSDGIDDLTGSDEKA